MKQVESATYPLNTERGRTIYGEAFRMGFEYLYGNEIRGAVAEFGTYEGFTTIILAELIREFADDQETYPDEPQRHLYVFDSFRGFPKSDMPEDVESYAVLDGSWVEGENASPPGTEEMLRAELGRRLGEENRTIVPGYYEETLRSGIDLPEVALVNVDCDLYQSSYTVLDFLMGHQLLPDGALLYLDDFNCNRANPRFGQRRVISDLASKYQNYELEFWQSYGWHGRAFLVHV